MEEAVSAFLSRFLNKTHGVQMVKAFADVLLSEVTQEFF